MRACDGVEALSMLSREPFDLMLLDLRMPKMDGREVLRRIVEAGMDVAVVVMTAHGNERVAVEALQCGAVDYVAKPFSVSEIVSKVERAITFHRTSQENKRLQQEIATERNLFEAVIKGMAELLVVVDEEAKVLLLNRAAEEVYGVSSQAAVGKPVHEVIRSDLSPDRIPCRIAIDMERPCLDVGYSIKVAGREVPVLSSAAPLTDSTGAIRGCVEISRDISARKALEREKEDFVSMLSHDLKSPITAIVGSIDLVREGRLGPVADAQREFLDTAVESCSDMVEMIDTLLDIHKFEAGKMQLRREEEEVALLVERAVYGLRAAVAQRGLTLVTDLPESLPTLCVDRGKMIRLLGNLLSNAVKFTPAGGSITVGAATVDLAGLRPRIPADCYNLATIPESGPYLAITVADTGEGIPPEALGTIFDRFVQARNRREGKTKGTGLGLAFCRKVMDAHDGLIWAESELGKGSLFTAIFPLGPCA
jgi:PAS domain S-box-containing protein